MNNNKNEIAIQWFFYAQGDLKSATALLEKQDIPLRNVCYLAQQSVEKGIKALLIFFGLPVIRTHDLDVLVNNLPNDFKGAFDSYDLSWLSEWSVEARYPGDWPETTIHEAEQAITMATKIITMVKDFINASK